MSLPQKMASGSGPASRISGAMCSPDSESSEGAVITESSTPNSFAACVIPTNRSLDWWCFLGPDNHIIFLWPRECKNSIPIYPPITWSILTEHWFSSSAVCETNAKRMSLSINFSKRFTLEATGLTMTARKFASAIEVIICNSIDSSSRE